MHTILIFRFDTTEPTVHDEKIFSLICSKYGENLTLQKTPYGIVAVARTEMSVGSIFFKYKIAEKREKTELPVFIFSLTEQSLKNSASFVNLRQMASIAEELKKKKTPTSKDTIENNHGKTIDDLLEQIHLEGIDSLTDRERLQLDRYAEKLKNDDFNK